MQKTIACLAAALALGACKGNIDKRLGENEKDRQSYSFGYQAGTALKNQKIEVDLGMYVAGVHDGLSGAKPKVSEEDIRGVFANLRKKAVAEQQSKMKTNLTAGKAFLEANKKKEGVKVLPSGLQYKVLKEGAGKAPTASDMVTVQYRGTLIDGSEFASSVKQGKPATLTLNRVIPGWREALPLMKEGSKWQLFVPPELAYGPRGNPGIEPNSTLIFEIELLTVAPGPTTPAR